jgi:NAD+--dinitrogen-reductase ADP-D-ribosyltransferase
MHVDPASTRRAGTPPTWSACRRRCWAARPFNAHPQPLHVAGARERTPACSRCWRSRAWPTRAAVFAHYMSLAFGLRGLPTARGRRPRRAAGDQLPEAAAGLGAGRQRPAGCRAQGLGRKPLRPGAGLPRAPLQRFPSPAWMAYLEEKAGQPLPQQQHLPAAGPAVRVLPVDAAALRAAGPGGPHVTLWRGSTAARSSSWPARCASGAARCA